MFAVGFKTTLVLACLLAISAGATAHAQHEQAQHEHAQHEHSRHETGLILATCEQVGYEENLPPGKAVTDAQQEVINETMGRHNHRVQHALWHAVRSLIAMGQITSGTEEFNQLSLITDSFNNAWSQGHSMCSPVPQNNADDPKDYNPAGEDFLFMHRHMIEHLQSALIAKGLKCIKPWNSIAETASWTPEGKLTGVKSPQALQTLEAWDEVLQNPQWLRGKSLSQVGFAVEMTVHNNLHMRYASDNPPPGFEEAAETGAPLPFNNQFPENWKFDDPKYNWLADPYGAALNPLFWKIHGYVDHIIDAWISANADISPIRRVSAECPAGDSTCYQWRGQWVGYLAPEPNPKLSVPRSPYPMPGAASQKARAMNRPLTDQEIEFNKQRMKDFRAGVIGDFSNAPEFPPVMAPSKSAPNGSRSMSRPKANALEDPFEYAAEKICRVQNK